MSYIDEFQPIRTITGTAPSTFPFREQAALAATQGQVVTATGTGGRVVEAINNEADVLGVCAQDATGTEDAVMTLYVVDCNTVFRAFIETNLNWTANDIFTVLGHSVGAAGDLVAGQHGIDDAAGDTYFVLDAFGSTSAGEYAVIAGPGSTFLPPGARTI